MSEQRDCEMYIDGDGVPFWLMDLALRHARSRFASVRVRAYKDWTNLGNNRLMESLWSVGADLVQVTPHKGLSNSTDIAIAVDAVETHHVAPTDWVALVANDGDFTSLAVHLRRKGVGVVGYGCGTASRQLVQSCDEFVHFDPATRTPSDPAATMVLAGRTLEDAVTEVVAQCAGEDGWTSLPAFGYRICSAYGLHARDAGSTTWSRYFASTGRFECARDAGGVPRVKVRAPAAEVA